MWGIVAEKLTPLTSNEASVWANAERLTTILANRHKGHNDIAQRLY